jgi:hypothetical protein
LAPPSWPPHQGYERDAQAGKDQLDDQIFEEAVAEGQAMTAAQAMSYALSGFARRWRSERAR